jgi:hypothetical protein
VSKKKQTTTATREKISMKRRKEEAEVIIRLDYQDQQAHVCVSAWPAMARKMERLYGKSLDGNSEQSRRWKLPLKAIGFRRTGKKTHLNRASCFRSTVKMAVLQPVPAA